MQLRVAAIGGVAVGIVILSLLVAAVAATVAIARPSLSRLDADLASKLAADYSSDPRSSSLPPLSSDVIEAAREDNTAIGRGQDQPQAAEAVTVFRPADNPGGDGPLPPAEPTNAPTSAPSPSPTPASAPSTRTATSTAAPTLTPAPTTAPTDAPAPTPTRTATPAPTVTLTPAPTATPMPTASPAETPTATGTPGPSPTDTETPTPSPVPSSTATGTPTPNASTKTPAATAKTGTPSPPPSPSITATPNTTAAATPTASPAPVDTDGDGIPNPVDNCPTTPNASQADTDGDGAGDLCDPDDDNDTVIDTLDNCQFVSNVLQTDVDADGIGDACDVDRDNDTVIDTTDNCLITPNPAQADNDADGAGDACDSDDDNDGKTDLIDNCQFASNLGQEDADGDSMGDACDPDDDGDTVPDNVDNCPLTPNPSQADGNGDGVGDACDGVVSGTLTAVADTYVDSAADDTNYGASTSMAVDNDERSLLKFDLSTIPAYSTIQSATLTLCLAALPPGAAIGRTHELKTATSAWTEMGVTWNSQPSVSGSSNHSWVVPPVGCVFVDVSTDIQAWVSGMTNYGWRLADQNESVAALVEYATREAAVAGVRPTLSFSYEPPPVLSMAGLIGTGAEHSCAINGPSGVECWGKNIHGQLGDGTHIDSSVALGVLGLGSQVTSVTGGLSHTCVLTGAGGVKCWGRSDKGQLGNGATMDSDAPVDVTGLASGVSAVAAGAQHTCALTTGGAVKCWGLNLNGQLGNGGSGNSSVPVSVSGLSAGVGAIAAGDSHTCAVLLVGSVKCWGLNTSGQLGDGSTTSSDVPVAVSGLSIGFGAVAAGGSHSCAVSLAGQVECWGRNLEGQLGDGSNTGSPTPVSVSGLIRVQAITAGQFHTCAATASGKALCWGKNNRGQLGDGTTTDRNTPVQVSGMTAGVVDIAGGAEHSCLVLLSGGGWCWGQNLRGQLGNGTSADSAIPVSVLGIP